MDIVAEHTINNKKLQLVTGDITERGVDAIVNAANSHLQHGGGVAAAIVRKGGQIIQDESNKIGFIPAGNAVLTTAGNLKAKFVIHTVGPRMGEGDEENKLKLAVNSVLLLATQRGFKSISMPAISSGIFGFPKDKCAKILITESYRFFKKHPDTALEAVEFCIFDSQTLSYFKKEFDKLKRR